MRRGVEQSVLLHLSLNLDQRVAQPSQERDRGRLVVDEGTSPAVGPDHAPQRQNILAVESLFGEDPMGGMVVRHLE